jgi:dihydroorotate dehydrogenase
VDRRAPLTRAAYRRDRSYAWNYEHGPSLPRPRPRVPATPLKELLGFRVRSRVGISAGILLNSRWIERYSRLGFDVLTYKTVRSARRPCYPLPNWLHVEPPPGAGSIAEGDPILRVRRGAPPPPRDSTSAVCFGMPSMAPEVWRSDVLRARKALGRGQILVVSVVGTPAAGAGEDALIEDFVLCARWAAAAGAHCVEANYSCPNVTSAEGSIYQDPGASGRLTRALRDALPSTPFLIKAGHFETVDRLRAFVRVVRGVADALVIVNGISRRVVGRGGKPAFPGHERVGILGRALHGPAVEAVRDTVAIAGARLPVLAVGGVLGEEDAAEFFTAGAAAVLSGSGAALDPLLAIRLKRAHPEW